MSGVITVKGGGLFEAITALESVEPPVRRAVTRTVRKVTNSITKVIASEIAKGSRVPVKALTKGGSTGRGRRVVSYFRDDGLTGAVWVGYNPIKAGYVGTPVQQVRGARVGRHTFPGAFDATMRSGHRSIFVRTGKGRLPLEEKLVSIDIAPGVVAEAQAQARTRLSDVLLQELNYEINVKGRR